MKKRCKKIASGPFVERLEGRRLLSGVVRELTGTVFYDLNISWSRDPGELPVVGATVFADMNVNGKVDDGEAAATTDGNGHYSLMTDGDRGWLKVAKIPGWAMGTSYYSDLTPTVRDFPMGTAPAIRGIVFDDDDANGLTGGTTPRAGVGVFLDRNGNGLVDEGEETAVTDAEGKYLFEDIAMGAVQIRAVPMEGWSQSGPIQAGPVSVGYTTDSVVFTYRSKTISGTIFKDLDRDGVRDEGEGGFNNVIISATWGKTFGIDSRIVAVAANSVITYPNEVQDGTEPDGSFILRDVPLFSSQIVIPIYDWYLSTSPNDPANVLEIGLAHPSDLSSDPQGTVRGIVFNDLNHNGTMDAGEPPMAGVQVGVSRTSSGQSYPYTGPTDATDSDGFYELKVNRDRYSIGAGPFEYANSSGPYFSIFEGETENINIPVSFYSFITWKVIVEFHNQPATPTGEMWSYLDRNNNNKRDADEPRIIGTVGPGVFESWQTTTTVPGPYTIRIEKLPNHRRLISPLPSGNAVPGQSSEHVDPIVLEATVYRTRPKVFFDKNRNGKLDPREPLLQNVTVLVDNNENGVKDSDERTKVTDFAGRFSALLQHGTTKLKLTIPGRYQRLGLFARDWTIRIFSAKDAKNLLIGLPARKK